jgi:hypothetical protein
MPKSVSETYPELFHYTGIDGLMGILRSQTIWATHAAFLNDTHEIIAFRSMLSPLLRRAVANGISERIRRDPAIEEAINQDGGQERVIANISSMLDSSIYKILLGSQKESRLFEPYIASFCSPDSADIAQHGLLSQWRGYGPNGGYAIVFDSSALEALLREEHDAWRYHLILADAVYSSHEDAVVPEEFKEDMEKISTAISKFIDSDLNESELDDTFRPILHSALRYKHWGFHEEREVRIVAMPTDVNRLEKGDALVNNEQKKPRRYFTRGGMAVPFIELFDGITSLPEKPLPVARIIVGPHNDQARRRRALEIYLNQHLPHIEVSASEIPYVAL